MRENWELLTKIDEPEDGIPESDNPQFELISDFFTTRRSTASYRPTHGRTPTWRQSTDSPRRDGFGKNLHNGECHSECPIADTRHLTQ